MRAVAAGDRGAKLVAFAVFRLTDTDSDPDKPDSHPDPDDPDDPTPDPDDPHTDDPDTNPDDSDTNPDDSDTDPREDVRHAKRAREHATHLDPVEAGKRHRQSLHPPGNAHGDCHLRSDPLPEIEFRHHGANEDRVAQGDAAPVADANPGPRQVFRPRQPHEQAFPHANGHRD